MHLHNIFESDSFILLDFKASYDLLHASLQIFLLLERARYDLLSGGPGGGGRRRRKHADIPLQSIKSHFSPAESTRQPI